MFNYFFFQRGIDGQKENPEISYAKIGPRTPKTNDRVKTDETYMSVHPNTDCSR